MAKKTHAHMHAYAWYGICAALWLRCGFINDMSLLDHNFNILSLNNSTGSVMAFSLETVLLVIICDAFLAQAQEVKVVPM